MPVDHREKEFENAIENHLLNNGYIKSDPNTFDKANCLEHTIFFDFLESSQPNALNQLKKQHGSNYQQKILKRLDNEIKQRGMIEVFRKGIIDLGIKLNLAYFKPASGFNPDTLALYDKNILSVTRQLKYSTKHENSLDLVLSVNGLPLASIELKNKLTGQSVRDAINQYRERRDPREKLFKFNSRILVHFAVDQDEVYMTTRLNGYKTYFLPFNKGHGTGAGNPPNPLGYKTDYLWKIIWHKDSWLEILCKFIHVQREEQVLEGKIVKTTKLIFPRFHQLDVVRYLIQDVKTNGCGNQYLIQHSAGSGKSNSIAWLAHQLASLHDSGNNLIFDSVVIVSDRKVLDQQLQDTVYQFEHQQGVVQRIDKDSKQLVSALERGAKIIITTLQKFPVVLEIIEANKGSEDQVDLPKRNFAVIVDEAHSSQSGLVARKLKQVLAYSSLEEAMENEKDLDESTDSEEELLKQMLSRERLQNLSFFAFTATPKNKTLETFGVQEPDSSFKPFHLYSMRQAIEEGFILDVLKNYTTYEVYFKLEKTVLDDPEYDKKKATKAIARFVTLHPHNISQKTEVIIEHFRRYVRHKIGRKAKAMVLTSSRLHALRYKFAFDKYIKENKYEDVCTLIAFSGTLKDDGKEYTERGLNKFKETELPERFSSADYNVLIVANKYQTGFDQPLLHTMYVDKPLDKVQAVQALSRLNRTYPGKEDTFVLDFVNSAEKIKQSFQPFYEEAFLESSTDPNLLFDLKNQLDTMHIYFQSEIEEFIQIFFKPREQQEPSDQGKLNAVLDKGVERYIQSSSETKEEFRTKLNSFVRLYGYLSQIITFQSIELEKLYAYGRFLYKKLPKELDYSILDLDDDVALEYYRLQRTSEGDIDLVTGEKISQKAIISGGAKKMIEKDKIKLSTLIEKINARFGTDFSDSDELFFEQIERDLITDSRVTERARVNSLENFKLGLKDEFNDRLIERRNQNTKIFNKVMSDSELKEFVVDYLAQIVHKQAQKAEA